MTLIIISVIGFFGILSLLYPNGLTRSVLVLAVVSSGIYGSGYGKNAAAWFSAGGPLDRGLPPGDPRFSLLAGALVKMTLDTDTAATSTAAGGYEILLLKDE